MKKILLIFVFLSLISSLSGNLGILTTETNQFIIFILLILLTIIIQPIDVKKFQVKYLYVLLPISIIIPIILICVELPYNLSLFFVVALYIYLVKILSSYNSQIDRILSIFLFTMMIYICYLIIYYYVPPVWLIFQTYSRFLSSNVAALFGKKALFGATTLGVKTILPLMELEFSS
jgi:hypothetical protein